MGVPIPQAAIEEAMSRYDPCHGERSFQNSVIELARVFGWTVFWTPNSKHSPPGELDLRMIRPPRYLCVELKSDHGTLTDDQHDTVNLLKPCPGVECFVWWPCSWPTIEEVLKR